MREIKINKIFFKPETKEECISIKCSNCYILITRQEPDFCNYKRMEREMWNYMEE